MRAVCTRGRFEGGWKQLACVCICAHTRGRSRIPFLFLSARRRKEYILARRSFIISAGRSFFSTLRQSFFCLASFFSFPPSFFQTDHPLFRTARASPPERGGNRGRKRGEKPQLSFAQPRFSARLVIISLVIILCVHFAVFVVAVVQLRSLQGRLTGI